MKKIVSLFRSRHRLWRDALLLLLLLGAATFISFVLDHDVSLVSQSMFYVLAVVIASYYLGWLAAIVCAFSAVAALNFFFVPPRWTFQVEHTEHLIALVTMLILALVINRLSSGMRRETDMAHLNERRARQLQQLAIELAEANEAEDVMALGKAALQKAFPGEHLMLLTGSEGKPAVICSTSSSELNASDDVPDTIRDGLACCMKEAAVIGAGTGRWSELDAWYLPLGESVRGIQPVGAVCIQQVSADDESGREHASALCSILGQALTRLQLRAAMLMARSEAQRQQLQGIFLAAVSHDLRTPLAVIVGAASAMQLQREKLHANEQARLLNSIVSEAAHLSTLTENTLQLVRLSNSTQSIRRDWESMEEIIGTVLARLRQHDPDKRIVCRLQNDLPLLRLDPVLIAQLITNLLDNALKYTEQQVCLTVDVSREDNGQERMLVMVKDRGAGISESEQQHIFEPYTRGDHGDRATQRGSGLGLAVCRAIAQVHHGELILRRRSGGGSSFIVSLPVDADQPVTMEGQQ